jgi:dienelactone hydrolase
LRTAAHDPRVRSVVSLAAPTDIGRYVQSVAAFAPSRHRQIVEWMGGTREEVPERYAILRGLSCADRIRQPVLLVHGTLDMITPVEHTVWMEQALREAGNRQVRVELIDRMGHFCELASLGYQFDRVTGLAITSWPDPTITGRGAKTRFTIFDNHHETSALRRPRFLGEAGGVSKWGKVDVEAMSKCRSDMSKPRFA